MRKRIVITLAALLLLAPWTVLGETPAVEEIVKRANLAAYYAGDDGRAEVSMEITDSQGRVRKRAFVILRRDVEDGGEQKFYVYFKKPSDVRKMVFMVHKHLDRDDDRWLYLPALDLVKRIAASDKRTSFVGSHFFYEDVSGRTVEADRHELVDTTEEFFVLENTPKEPDSVEFSAYTLWIDRENYLPRRAVYKDKGGKEYREVTALEVEEIDGHPTVTKSLVRDLVAGGETVSEFRKIRYDMGLDDGLFTERYLRRPPREVR
jgi:outer membrane lipoprotein-sorting protein